MRFVRIGEVMLLTGLSRTSIWRAEREGRFPRRRKISANAVAWDLAEIERWREGRPVVGAGTGGDDDGTGDDS